MFKDIVRTRSPSLPAVLQGFGDITTDIQLWTGDIFKPIIDAVKQYYDTEAKQYGVQAQQLVQSTPSPTIKPIYLIGGGITLWWLFKGGVKSKKKYTTRRRR